MAAPTPNPTPHTPMGQTPAPKSAMGIIGFVLGIIAILGSWIPILNNFAFIFVVLGIAFSIVGLVGISRGKESGKGLAIAALIISIVAGAVVLGTQSLYSEALNQATGEATVAEAPASDAGDTAATTDAQATDGAADADYTIADEALDTSNGFSANVTGTLTNNIDSDKSYVQVEYTFYDKDGAQIGTGLANTSNLKAGGIWKFEAMSGVDPDEVASYERVSVTGW